MVMWSSWADRPPRSSCCGPCGASCQCESCSGPGLVVGYVLQRIQPVWNVGGRLPHVVNLSDEAAVLMLVDCDCRSTLSCDVASLAEGVRRQRIEQVPLLIVEVQIGTRDLVRAWAQPDFVAQLVGVSMSTRLGPTLAA